MTSPTMDIPEASGDTGSLRRRAQEIRALSLAQVLHGGGGYLGQTCSSAEIFAVLFGHTLRLGESEGPLIPEPFTGVPGSPNESPNGGRYLGARTADHDRFIVSPSHYAMTLYAALISDGRLSREALAEFNTDGTSLEMIGAEHSPGCDLTTGSFGQALSQAAGIAWARRFRGESGRVVVFVSDGELQEGQTWEAMQFLAFHSLDNVHVVVDVNGQQVDGRMDDVMYVDARSRMEAFGADVREVDGHSIDELIAALSRSGDGRPVVTLAVTHPTTGIPSLTERSPKFHYIRVRDERDREQLGAELAQLEKEILA